MVTEEEYFINLSEIFNEVIKLIKTNCFRVTALYSQYENDNQQGIRTEEINNADDFCFFIYKFINEYKFYTISIGNYNVNPTQVYELKIDKNTGQLIEFHLLDG